MPHDRPLSLDTPLVSRTVPRIAQLASELLDAGLSRVPGAEGLPPEHFASDVTPSIVAVVAAVLRAIDEQRPVDAAEVSAIIAPVVEQQAEERIPLRLTIRAVFGGVRRLWDEVTTSATPEDLDELSALSEILLDVLEHALTTIAEIHSQVARSVFGAERETRQSLTTALLRGGPVDELANRAGVPLASAFDLLAIRVLVTGRTHPPTVETAIAQRRVRLARELLDDLSGMNPLHVFDGTSGHVLLTAPADAPDDHRYSAVAVALTERLGSPVVVIEMHDITRADLPTATRHLDELAELALALGKPAGSYTLDDLMIEFQLTRPGPARDRLAGRLEPLRDHPHLVAALRAHIRYGWDRKQAAATVHLHPNSFSYRLRRVADLTGFDPSHPYDSRVLAAALLLSDLGPGAPVLG
ncbi:PucR family transcriptional regulator [Nocardia thailandica]